jgi:ABC-type Na+ efflux pump permease subunit
MKLLLTVPVNRRSITTAAKTIPTALIAVAVMYFAFGLLGAAVLTALVVYLGRLLIRAARAE